MRTSSLSTLSQKNASLIRINATVNIKSQNYTISLLKNHKHNPTKIIAQSHHHNRSNSMNLNQNKQIYQLKKSPHNNLSTIVNKNLKNFHKKQQSSQTYIKEWNNLRKTSFLLSNRLTKSVFDIGDAAMIGKPQGLRQFKSTRTYSQNQQGGFGLLKTAVRKITGKQQEGKDKLRKSLIPQVYQKTFSLAAIESINNKTNHNKKKSQLNTSLDKSFFPTTTYQPKTQTNLNRYQQKRANNSIVDTSRTSFTNGKIKFKQLKTKADSTTIIRLSKPSSQRKLRNIDNKLQQLKSHNESTLRLMPVPIQKPQKIIIKGRGQLVSLQKITRVIDKLLSALQLYFQMYEQNGERVMDYVRNVEGFDNDKLKQIFCQSQQIKSQLQPENKVIQNKNNSFKSIKHMHSNTQILQYFWIYKSSISKQKPQHKQQQSNCQHNKYLQLPQFWGQQDYSLYKLLNNFSLKLQSKYEHILKQKYKKMKQLKVQKSTKQFNKLYQHTLKQSLTNKSQHNNKSVSYQNNPHLDRKLLLSKIKYHPINSDKKIFNQMQELQDLGVKFDFRQKGKSIILGQKSSILHNSNV